MKCVPGREDILNFNSLPESYEIEFLKAGFKRTVKKTYQDTGAKNEKEKVFEEGWSVDLGPLEEGIPV